MGDMTAQALNQVEAENIKRFTTFYGELDWIYGQPGGWGMPKGKISLWSGEPGVGKSRLLAQIMQTLAEKGGCSTLIAQGEVSAGQFKSEKFKNMESPHIYITTQMDIDSICDNVRKIKPYLLFIDSIQTVATKDAQLQDVMDKLRSAIAETGTHVVLISQLNKSGQSKGTTTLPHLVDIEAFLYTIYADLPGGSNFFGIKINKNRYGKSGKRAACCHMDWGVDVQSEDRFEDPDWLDPKGHIQQFEQIWDDYYEVMGEYLPGDPRHKGSSGKSKKWKFNLPNLFSRKKKKSKKVKPKSPQSGEKSASIGRYAGDPIDDLENFVESQKK